MGAKEKGVREFYDATAAQWADRWYQDESMLPLLTAFVAKLPDRPRVLDAGCGAGYESMRLMSLGASVVGVDFSEESIRIARERNPCGAFHVMDCTEMDEGIGTFDGIAAIALIVHMRAEQLAQVFAGFRRAIRPAGCLLVAFVEGDGFSEKRSHVEIDGEPYNREFYLHPSQRVIDAAREAGFAHDAEWFLDDQGGGWRYLVFMAAAE